MEQATYGNVGQGFAYRMFPVVDEAAVREELLLLLKETSFEVCCKIFISKIAANSILQTKITALEEAYLNKTDRDSRNQTTRTLENLIYNLRQEDLKSHQILTSVLFPKEVIRTGYILYQIPKEMVMDEEHTCLIKISYEREMVSYDGELSKNYEVKKIPVTASMDVKLYAPNDIRKVADFRIETVPENTQPIHNNSPTEWKILITPGKTGGDFFKLMVSTIEEGDAGKQTVVFETEQRVHIITAPPEQTSTQKGAKIPPTETPTSSSKNNEQEQIKNLIAKGETRNALTQFMELAQKEKNERIYKELILVSSRLSAVEREGNMGTQSTEDMQRTRNQINYSILQMLEGFK